MLMLKINCNINPSRVVPVDAGHFQPKQLEVYGGRLNMFPNHFYPIFFVTTVTFWRQAFNSRNDQWQAWMQSSSQIKWNKKRRFVFFIDIFCLRQLRPKLHLMF